MAAGTPMKFSVAGLRILRAERQREQEERRRDHERQREGNPSSLAAIFSDPVLLEEVMMHLEHRQDLHSCRAACKAAADATAGPGFERRWLSSHPLQRHLDAQKAAFLALDEQVLPHSSLPPPGFEWTRILPNQSTTRKEADRASRSEMLAANKRYYGVIDRDELDVQILPSPND